MSETTEEKPRVVPKLCGADVELGAFRLGTPSAFEAEQIARALLREIDGVPGDTQRGALTSCLSSWTGSYGGYARDRVTVDWGTWLGGSVLGGTSSYDPQDWGRKFLPANGGCAYIDLGHLELCQPEVLSAFDHVASWHAMLRIARRALTAANRRESVERGITVLVNNSDGHGNSYGSHLNFLVTRRTWNNLFRHKLHHLLYLASYQASAIVFAGAGKAGSENGAPPVDYQLSQRADFVETLTGVQTTYQRPLVNARDQALCGSAAENARLHVIFFDSTLCHVSSLLKVGVTQMVLAMIEADRVNPALLLDSPLEALRAWSHDPSLSARAKTVGDEALTAVELQQRFVTEAKRFAAEGGFAGVVPRADEILALWEDTLRLLEQKDFSALESRLDWVLKLSILRRVLAARADLDWASPQVKHLDHVYASLDASDGLYWAFERDGHVAELVSDAEIERFVNEPPDDTRAWTRAMLLRSAERRVVQQVDWDAVHVRLDRHRCGSRVVALPNPLAGTRAEMAPVFAEAGSFDDLMDVLAPPVDACGAPGTSVS